MQTSKLVGKREFIQHTSRYLKWVEEKDQMLVITHQNKPDLIVSKIRTKSIRDLQGIANIKVHGNINAPVFPGYEKW